MRTKHILLSMALGVAVVGCSDNELMTVEKNTTDAKLSIRPVVDVNISLNADGADTRFDIGTGARPVWSTKDKVGAAIIDVPTYNGPAEYKTKLTAASGKVTELYTIIESYGCNNAFSTTDAGATWAAEHPMVEGNYLFYAPYNENMSLRSPLIVAVPTLQDASATKSALEEFYKSGSVVQVGYKFITGADKKKPTNIKMFDIFSYPKFTIKNNFDGYLFDATSASTAATAAYSGKIKVDSIQFVNANAAQAAIATTQIGGKLKHANTTTATATTATAGVVSKLAAAGDWNDVDKVLAEVTTLDLLDGTNDKVVVGRGKKGASDIMDGVITTLKVGQEIEKGKSIDVYCVMPAAKFNFNDNQLVAKIFVTINNVEYEIYQAVFTGTGKDSWAPADVKLNAAAANKGYVFGANGNSGLNSLSFMIGQSYPSEALKVDANGNYAKKVGVNNLLEINLTGGMAKKTGTADVQIAVRKGSTNEGITTTSALIEMIENAANGTVWVENATDGADAKGFKLAPINTVEINSALIDALAKNNQNGGSFKLAASVLPISNDVILGSVDASGKTATFSSAKGNTATIALDGAIVADNKYILITTAASTLTADANSVVLVAAGGSLTLSVDATVKSLVIAPAIKGGAIAGIVSVANSSLTASNINNYGSLTVKTVTAENILNKGEMTVNGTVAAPTSKKLAFTNNGEITTGAIAAKFTVTAGEGTIILPEATASAAALVGAAATQDVIYSATTTVATAQITAAAAIPSVTAIQANGAITLKKDDIAKFVAIKTIIADAAISATETEKIDLTGFTLILTKNANWTGGNVTQSVVTGLTVEAGDKTLTLSKVSMTGIVKAKKGGGIIAGGVTEKWNGGASEAVK